jgi:hypothetical protein
MIAEGNSEMFQSYSNCVMEAYDFCWQNSVSDIIAAHFKTCLLSFEKHYPEYEDPWMQIMWIVKPLIEHNETALFHEETFHPVELSTSRGPESTSILFVIRNSG